MAPLPRGVYWWLPLIPFSWKKHIRRKPAECVSVRVCVGQACLSLLTSLSSQSYRALKPDLLPGNHVTPEAGQYQYYTLKREAWGLWDKAKLPKKKKKDCHHPSRAQRWKTVQKPNSEYSWFLRNTRRLPLVVYFCGALQNLCLFLWLTLRVI